MARAVLPSIQDLPSTVKRQSAPGAGIRLLLEQSVVRHTLERNHVFVQQLHPRRRELVSRQIARRLASPLDGLHVLILF